MKFILFAFATLFVLSCTNTDTTSATVNKEDSIRHQRMLDAAADSANYTSIQWLDSMHKDLGKVTEGAQLEISWRFKNTGNKPLIISQANASCGCTVAEKPEAPVPPGEEGRIKATFNSNDREGTQNKDVMVMANTSPNDHKLSFTVEVSKK